jgi:hypothetical protein
MKLLIALATALTTSAAMAATFTFTNHTHYVFLKNAQTPVCASSPISSPCQDVIGPEESEQFTIPSDGENIVFSANYAGGAYFGFYVSNQNGKLSVDTKALNEKYASHNMQGSFTDNTLTMSATDPLVPVVYGTKLALHGVNLSGAEAGQGEDYMTNLGWWIPSYEDAVPYLQTGANTVRFPIRWGYITTTNEKGAYLDAVYAEVLDLLKNNVTVILDLHNYMRIFPIPLANHFAAFLIWKLSLILVCNPGSISGNRSSKNHLIFSLNSLAVLKKTLFLISSFMTFHNRSIEFKFGL